MIRPVLETPGRILVIMTVYPPNGDAKQQATIDRVNAKLEVDVPYSLKEHKERIRGLLVPHKYNVVVL